MSHVQVSCLLAGTKSPTDTMIDCRGIGHKLTIICEVLGKRKICSQFVPHMVTDDQREKWMETVEISLPGVTKIHLYCELSSKEKRPGVINEMVFK